MKNVAVLLILLSLFLLSACSTDKTAAKADATSAHVSLVLVKGGTFANAKSGFYGTTTALPDFYIGQNEITQMEWTEVMGSNPSQFIGDGLPVENVSWYEAIEYCNKRSQKEGLTPYYDIEKQKTDPVNKSPYDQLKWSVTAHKEANGYRLPTEAEWEYAASGGQQSQSYTYSGSNQADEVAWYWRNSGNKKLTGDWSWPVIESNHNQTKPVGSKKPNELGLYDMSGNVREWCWDWYEDADTKAGAYRVVKGGGWIGDIGSGEVSFRGKFEANGFGPDQGFRVVRNAE